MTGLAELSQARMTDGRLGSAVAWVLLAGAVAVIVVVALRVGRTVLLIAHRPELARRADRVVTLAGGRVLAPAEVEAA